MLVSKEVLLELLDNTSKNKKVNNIYVKMRSWHIWNFPDKLYVLLNKKVHKEFFNQMFKNFGGKRPYARFLGISQKGVKQYWRSYSKKGGKVYVQYIPLWIFKKSCKTYKLKRKIENGIEKIRVRAGNPITLNLPIKESPSLYRITAHLIGDGFAGELKVPYYSNTCKRLRQQFKKDLQIFGKIKTYERTPDTTPCVMFPKPITDILRYIFNIEFIRPSKLPSEIFSASEKCKCALLQALFDDEGTVSSNLVMSMSNLNIIKEIKMLVKGLDLTTSKISFQKSDFGKGCYYFRISEKDIGKFKDKVGFDHPLKSKRLDIRLRIKERNKLQRTRPLNWTRGNIVKLLKEKPRTTVELSNKLLLTSNGLYPHLNYLTNQNLIKKGGYRNKFLWSFA